MVKLKSNLLLICCLLLMAMVLPSYSFAQTKKTPLKKTVKPLHKTIVAKKTVTKPQPIFVKIVTDSGSMIVMLYDSTPLHRDNFVKLIKDGFYDSLLFHRVIPQFMIQGGDPTSKNATPGELLGAGGDSMVRIPAEFHSSLFHKKGALAAARDNNPQMASSACQFYLVEGKIYTDDQLNMIESQKGIKFSASQRQAYKTIGGIPFLDQAYTVFGQVIKGIEVISKISHIPRDENNRPLTDIRMHIEIENPARK